MAADGTLDFQVTTTAQDLKANLALDSGDEVGIQNLDRVVEIHLREDATLPVTGALSFALPPGGNIRWRVGSLPAWVWCESGTADIVLNAI